MRYIIVGTGAIGGVLGSRLALAQPRAGAGHPPVFVARGDNAAALKSRGARLRSPDEDRTTTVEVIESPDEIDLRVDDVLVFATKTHQVSSALMDWADRPVHSNDRVVGFACDVLPVFTALNGVYSEEAASRLFRRVFGVTVWLPAVHLTPGEFVVRIAPVSGMFTIGRYAASPNEADRALLDVIAADWRAASFRISIVDDVMRWKHQKLLMNLGNAVQALLGERSDETAELILDAIRAEAVDVYRMAGIEWPDDDEVAAQRADTFRVRPVPGVEQSVGGSSWQSMRRGGGTIESDYLNGEIALIARKIGRDAPLNAALAGCARRAAASHSSPGDTTSTGLAEALGLRT